MASHPLTPISLFVGIKNNVSGTTIEDPRLRSKKHMTSVPTQTVKNPALIQVIEFLGNGMVLEIPARSCAVGHDLSVTIRTSGAPKDTEFSSTGKVIDCTALTKDRMQVCLDFLQLDKISWNRFRETLNQTQARMDELLADMRGY